MTDLFKLTLFVWSAIAGGGCGGPHKLISARHIGCAPRRVEIQALTVAADREDWIALCDGRSYACSTREHGRRLLYACAPLSLDAQVPEPPARAATRSPSDASLALDTRADGGVDPDAAK
jgi:hypothetical protein